MTTEVTKTHASTSQYPDELVRLAVAAGRRYGYTQAHRMLARIKDTLPGGRVPTDASIGNWCRAGIVEPTDEDIDFWVSVDATNRNALNSALMEVAPKAIAMVEELIDDRKAGDFQRAMIGIGILHDKITGIGRGPGGGGIVSIGDNATITMNVIAPPPDDRPAPRYIEAE